MPDLVCRGIQLIADGALDDATDSTLAGRLAVSPRHLRRMFLRHAGVTPDQLARSRRAHFARRLLDDTDLRIADIAFAAGFGSVRQLNRVLSDVFHGSPRELRARRRVTDRLQADGGLAIRLTHDGSLDFAAVLRRLAARAIPSVEEVTADSYRRTVLIDHDSGMIEITRRSPAELLLVAHLPRLDGLVHHVRRARRIFALDDPAETCGSWDPFEVGVHDVVRAAVPDATRTRAVLGDLADRYGQVVSGLAPVGLARMFPTPEILATAALDGLPISDTTVHALRSFAQVVVDRS
jgi:AraC family transcriptional regulator of adaptative response / DNA-3-methyladenine glycosylase II